MENVKKYKDFIKRTKKLKGPKNDIINLLEDIVTADIEKVLKEEGFLIYYKDLEKHGINQPVFIKSSSNYGLQNDYGIYIGNFHSYIFDVYVVERGEGHEWIEKGVHQYDIKKEEFSDFFVKNLEDYF